MLPTPYRPTAMNALVLDRNMGPRGYGRGMLTRLYFVGGARLVTSFRPNSALSHRVSFSRTEDYSFKTSSHTLSSLFEHLGAAVLEADVREAEFWAETKPLFTAGQAFVDKLVQFGWENGCLSEFVSQARAWDSRFAMRVNEEAVLP